MKEKATVVFRRIETGDVIGEIINATGKVVAYKNLGNLTNTEINNVIEVYAQENPDVNIMPSIEVIGN